MHIHARQTMAGDTPNVIGSTGIGSNTRIDMVVTVPEETGAYAVGMVKYNVEGKTLGGRFFVNDCLVGTSIDTNYLYPAVARGGTIKVSVVVDHHSHWVLVAGLVVVSTPDMRRLAATAFQVDDYILLRQAFCVIGDYLVALSPASYGMGGLNHRNAHWWDKRTGRWLGYVSNHGDDSRNAGICHAPDLGICFAYTEDRWYALSDWFSSFVPDADRDAAAAAAATGGGSAGSPATTVLSHVADLVRSPYDGLAPEVIICVVFFFL